MKTAVTHAVDVTSAEGAARFVQVASDFAGIVQLCQQMADVEARAKAAAVDATKRERYARVRTVAIAWVEWFVQRGVSEQTVAGWKAIWQTLGLTVETLAQGLADALQQFGVLEATCR